MKFIKKIKENKVLNIISGIIRGCITFVLLCMLAIIIVQRVTNNNFAIGGIRIFTIVSNSMRPEYTTGDILISKSMPASEIQLEDNVAYAGEVGDMKGKIITHKIVDKYVIDGKYHFVTQGVSNSAEDPEIIEDQLYGKIVYKFILLSKLCKLMSNDAGYYILFALVVIFVSYEVVDFIFEKRSEKEEIDEELTERLEIIDESISKGDIDGGKE